MGLKSVLERYELKLTNTDFQMIKVSTLYYQYIPMVQPEKWWNGYDMMSIRTSPHVELLEIYREYGLDWKILQGCGYWKEREARRKVHGRTRWTDKWIRHHIGVRARIYKSMRDNGFNSSLCKEDPIIVLKEPFWKTRYDWKNDNITGPEIFDGGGRCAAAYVLGVEEVPVLIAEDASPGSKKCDAIERKFKEVWKG